MEKDEKKKKKIEGITLLQTILCTLLCLLTGLLTRIDGGEKLKTDLCNTLAQSVDFEQLSKAFNSIEEKFNIEISEQQTTQETEQTVKQMSMPGVNTV